MDLLRATFELSPVPWLLADETGILRDANPAALRALGYAKDELVGLPRSILVVQDDHARLKQALERRARDGSAIAELRLRRRDGSEFPAERAGMIVPLPDGGRLFSTTFRDLSDREALSRSEEAFRVLADAALEAILIHKNGVVVLANEAAERLVGLAPGTSAGRSIFEFVAPEARAAVMARAASESAEPYEGVVLRTDGVRVPVVARGGRITYRGESLRIVALSDLSTLKHLEAQLVLADRLASIGQLAGGVAHEINNPLTYVTLNLGLAVESLARDAGPLAREVLPWLEEAMHGAERVRQIVHDLRQLAREPDPGRDRAELATVVAQAAAIARNEIRHKAALDLDVPEGVWVRGNETRLGQVFLNLMVNAAQAIPAGAAERHRITVRARPENGHRVVTEVSDTGEGIAPELLPRVFEPFVTTKAAQGSGLGLSIVRGIVVASGGHIEVKSELGAGTTFRVVLPASAPARRSPPPPRPDAPQRARVLVVDDEQAIRAVVGRLLERSHDVELADSGPAALALLERESAPFDGVLCDLMMPGMNGAELLDTMRRRWPVLAQRVVIMTGGLVPDRAGDLSASSGLPVLAKPFTLAQLLAAVEQARAAGSPDA